MLYEDLKFKRNLADTEDITVNPTTTTTSTNKNWLIAIGALSIGVVVLGIIAATGNNKEETRNK